MKTSYIRFLGVYRDPVWGDEVTPWVRTELIRVTRNRIGNAVFEWVGRSQPACIKSIKQRYPIMVKIDSISFVR